MADTHVGRLIIAPSHPHANRAIGRYLGESRADVMRVPRAVTVLNGAGNDLLTMEMKKFTRILVELHSPAHITLIGDDGLACIEAVSVIRDLLPEGDRRTIVSHTLYVQEGNPEARPPDDWNTVTVTCCDFRTPFEMVRTEYRRPDAYTFTVPGAAKALIGKTETGKQFFGWTAERGLGVRLFQHEDCHAYGPDLHADPKEELQRHTQDAAEFVSMAEQRGIPVIDKGIIRLTGSIEPL